MLKFTSRSNIYLSLLQNKKSYGIVYRNNQTEENRLEIKYTNYEGRKNSI